MLTCKKIQKSLNKIYPNVRFYRGDGYFYLVGKTEGIHTSSFYEASIYVCRLKHQSNDEWIKDCLHLIREGIKHSEGYSNY